MAIALSKTIYNLCGHAALALGLVGILLPIMPTTPFLILAAWCYSRGSPRFEKWITEHKIFGPPIANWRSQGAISRGAKALACVAIVSSMTLIVFVFPLVRWLKAILVFTMCGALFFVLSRPNPKA